MNRGYVYIMTNASMPGMVKVGKTRRSSAERAKELYQTGVPKPFVVCEEVLSPDCGELESFVHAALADCRVSQSREFFATDTLHAAELLRRNHLEQLNCWLDEFLPDMAIVNPDYIVCEGDVGLLAADTGVHPAEVASALAMVTSEELQPAFDRWRALVARRRAVRLAAVQ